jgi:hypothetical protein
MTSLTSLNSGFVAGTLVHTDQGLVPIERIKVGDLVLSKHESGEGERAYKRVVNTFKSSEKKAVRHVAISINYKKKWESVYLFCTPDHPFWVKGEGWIPISEIYWEDGPAPVFSYVGEDVASEIENVHLNYTSSVYESALEKGITYVYDRFRNYEPQIVVDFNLGRPVLVGGGGDLGYMEERWPSSEEKIVIPENYDHPLNKKYIDAVDHELIPFLTDVYNIEVEDFHTYYVGVLGLWVHDNHNYPAQ